MKKILASVFLCVLLIGQFQIGQIYANEQLLLESEKNTSLDIIENVERIVDNSAEKLANKEKNIEIKEQISEKREEIAVYLNEVREKIDAETSRSDIQELIGEAKKTVVLKVVAGTTSYEDITENIGDVAKTKQQKKAALKSLQDSLQNKKGDYSIIVKSAANIESVKKLFHTFDTNIIVEQMYQNEGENYYEVFIDPDSIFRKEMLADIEQGILPETFTGIKIVLPEVFSIGEVDISSENISQTWGIQQYESYKIIDENIIQNSKKIRVAVVDTGIDYTHPDLSGNVNKNLGKDFVNEDDDAYDDQGHGTHVAGTIAAELNNSGIIGVNPYLELVPLKICSSSGFCPSYAVLRALDYANSQKFDVLNMSLGGRGDPNESDICAGISSVVKSGGIVVAAAGNSNIDTSTFVPGGCSDAITVAAVDNSGKRASFSNYGEKVDIAAPGVNIYSTYPINKGSYKQLSGTSMSTPHIVGIISILQAIKSDISVTEIKNLFRENEISVTTESTKPIAGAISLSTLIEKLQVSLTVDEDLEVNEISLLQENSEQNEEEISETLPEEKNYEVLIPALTPVERDIEIVQDSEKQDQAVKQANEKLFMQAQEKQEENLGIASLFLDIFGEETQINSFDENLGENESGKIQAQHVDILENSESSGNQIYDQNGEKLPETQINTVDENIPETQGIQLPENFNFQNIDTSVFSENLFSEDTIEINSDSEIPELQEIYIDGAEKGVKINSEFSGEEMQFIEEENLQDIESFDFSNSEKIEIIPEDIHFQYQSDIYIDGAEKGIEMNSLGGDDESVLEIEEFSEKILKKKEFSHDMVQEVKILEPKIDKIYIDGAENDIEINSLGGNEEEYLEEAIPVKSVADVKDIVYPHVDMGEVETPEELKYEFEQQDTMKMYGDNEVIEGKEYTEIIDSTKENEEIIGLQSTYYCEIYIGQECNIGISYAYNYDFTIENPGSSSYKITRNNISFAGIKDGDTIYKLYKDGNLYFTIIIYVFDFTPREIEVTVEEGRSVTTYFPNSSANDVYVENKGGEAYVYKSSKSRYIAITGISPGDMDLYVTTYGWGVRYLVHVHVIPIIPEIVNLEVYEGTYVDFYIPGVGSYTFSTEDSNIVSASAIRNYLSIRGKTLGQAKFSASSGGYIWYIYNISVIQHPIPILNSVDLYTGQSSNIFFPENGPYKNYTFYSIGSSNGSSSITGNFQSFSIQANSPGIQEYAIVSGGVHFYTLRVKVEDKAPIEKILTLYEGQSSSFSCSGYGIYGQNDGIVEFHKSDGYCHIYTKKPGYTEVLTKVYSGFAESYLYKITVLPLPTPQEYSVKFSGGIGIADMYLPEDVSNFNISQSGSNIYDSLTNYGTYFHIDINRVGNSDIIIKDKSYNFTRYIIHVISEPSYEEYILHETDKIKVWYNDRYDFTVLDSGIVSYSYDDNGGYLTAYLSGSTQVNVYHNTYGLLKIWTIKVIPKPEIIQVNCSVEVGNTCELMIPNGGYYYDTNLPYGYYDVDSWRDRIRISSERSGYFTAYMLSNTGKYITHVFSVTVTPKAAKVFNCDIAVEGVCNLGRTYLNNRTLTFQETNPGLVEILYNRQSMTGVSTKETKDYEANNGETYYYDNVDSGYSYKIDYTLKALKEGDGEIYIFDENEHLYTVKIHALEVTPIEVESRVLKVGQGDTISTQILAGGGNYRPYDVHTSSGTSISIDYFDTDSDKDANGFYLATGEVKLRENIPGNYYPIIADRYNQLKELSLVVEDVDLILGSYRENMKVGEQILIPIYERYQKITNIDVNKGDIGVVQGRVIRDATNNTEYLEITALATGNAVVGIQDAEGNKESVEIAIGVRQEDESEDDTFTEEEKLQADQNIEDILRAIGLENVIINSENGGVEVNEVSGLSQIQKDIIDAKIKNYLAQKGENFLQILLDNIPRIRKKYVGETYQQVLDYIEESIEKQISFKVIHSIENITDGEIGGLEFQVSPNLQGKISNIGVQFTNELGQKERQDLKIQSDGNYIVAFSQDSCKGCKDIIPYYLLSGNTHEVIAQFNESTVEVAASSYEVFRSILTNIWYWKGYDKEYNRVANGITKKIVDLKEDIRYAAMVVSAPLVLNIIAQTGNKDIPLIEKYTNYTVATPMLQTFLDKSAGTQTCTYYEYGKDSQICVNQNTFYDTNHIISQEIAKTEDYKKYQQIAVNYNNLTELQIGDKILVGYGDDGEFLLPDLYYSIHFYNWRVYLERGNDGNIYSIVEIFDDYDFPENAEYTFDTAISTKLNAMGYYYESNLKGQTFDFIIQIKEIINQDDK